MHPERIGPYLITRKIGSGGMGAVYLGQHETTQEVVAVKVLPASLAREEGFVLRFGREVEAMQKVSSPHIVRLIDSGLDGETYYYSMEYVEGETLTSRLKRDKKIPWPETVELVLQICAALKSAHDAGIIHRDLKPSNLLIANDGCIKLTDFGVAQVFASNRLTITGGVIGTAEYMSPEQAQGQRATKRSDLYSLGAVMYAMLTGRPPFVGSTTVEILQKHRYGQFDRVKRYLPEIPPFLDDLVNQLLEKDPAKRPPDALVLSRQLRDFLQRIDLQSTGETMVSRVDDVAVGETLAASEAGFAVSGAHGAFGPTFMRDMVRAELEQATIGGPWQQLTDNIWFLLTALALLIAIPVTIYYSTERLTPQERFERGLALMDQDPGSDWLTARNHYFIPLLKEDPDAWRDKVQPFINDVDGYELERTLLSRRRSSKKPQNELERLLLQSRRMWEAGDWKGAEERLRALRILSTHKSEYAAFTKLIDRWLEEIQDQRPSTNTQKEFLHDQLSQLDQLQKSDPDSAEKLRKSLLALYEDDPVVLEWITAGQIPATEP